jgi:hypothetical protein
MRASLSLALIVKDSNVSTYSLRREMTGETTSVESTAHRLSLELYISVRAAEAFLAHRVATDTEKEGRDVVEEEEGQPIGGGGKR